jgi:hypothetical protein
MITDPQAIKFANEVVRPIAEKLRGLKAEIDSHMLTWHAGGVGAMFGGDNLAASVEDGRENEGVSRLTGNDVVGLLNQVEALQTQLDGVGVMNVIAKPCVRALRAE